MTNGQLALQLAYAFKGWPELGGDNHGQAVEIFQKFVGIKPGDPWCAAFASYVGWHAMLDIATGTSKWPLKLTGGCGELFDDATAKKAIVTVPKPGMLFLIWHTGLKRMGHTGWIVGSEANNHWRTCEGNSNLDGSRNGWEVADRTGVHARLFGDHDRFIDWEALIQ